MNQKKGNDKYENHKKNWNYFFHNFLFISKYITLAPNIVKLCQKENLLEC